MSATRDQSQKITFVYSNLHAIYRKGLERARQGATQGASPDQASLSSEALSHFATGRGLTTGAVIKADSPAAQQAKPMPAPPAPPAPPVSRAYTPAELLGKRVVRPAALKVVQENPVASLKQNLDQLNDLQARLRFMLKELEDLIKE